jgi:hypothetical protein
VFRSSCVLYEFSFSYAGDARIKAKVKGIVCGIKDIQFVGDMRIILSPLINTIPLVGAVTYFFLRNPVSTREKKLAYSQTIY